MTTEWTTILPRTSHAAIDDFEARSGLRVPSPVRTQLLLRNGGLPRAGGFRFALEDGSDFEGRLHLLYGVGEGPCALSSFLQTGVPVPEGQFPIGRTTTGDILFFSEDARVTCWIHDEEREDDGALVCHAVHSGLQDFLARLDDALLRGPVRYLEVPEAGFTWHLDGDGEHALLVPSDIHDATPHLTPRILGQISR